MSEAVSALAVSTRQGLIDTLEPLGYPTCTESVAVVGLPGLGADEVLRHLEMMCIEAGARTSRFRLEELRLTDGPSQLLDRLLREFDPDWDVPDESFEAKLSALRDMGIGRAQLDEALPILFLEGLHEIARIDIAKHAQVQAILDCLQAAATEEPRWARVWASSHIEPARACESIGWSSFYKVFGPRVYYLGMVETDAARCVMLRLLGGLSDQMSVVAGVDEALALMPLVPRVLAEAVVRIEADGKFAPSGLLECQLQRDQLCNRWRELLEGDFAVLGQLDSSTHLALGPLLTSARRLQRFGLVVEDGEGFHAAASLGCSGLGVEDVAPVGDSYVRGLWHVPSAARPLVRGALVAQGIQYAELEVIQHREGEALVLKVVREDPGGIQQRPWILKVDSRSSIEREAELTEEARAVLGPAVPQILSLTSEGGTGCLLTDFACADTRSFSVRTLEDLLLMDGGPIAPANMLSRLLDSVLAALYANNEIKRVKLRGFYHVPRPTELEALLDLRAGSEFDFAEVSALQEAIELVFGRPCDTILCERIHGDLNARNILVDGAHNVHVIDFSTFKQGPLAKDFARVEIEILFRIFDDWTDEAAWAFAHLLSNPDLVNASRILFALGVSSELSRVASCIRTVRSTCSAYWDNGGVLDGRTFRADYLAALAASALRTALFQEYSSASQRRAAVTFGFAALRAAGSC